MKFAIEASFSLGYELSFCLSLTFFYGKKTTVSSSTPCNDKRFLGLH